MREMDKLAKDRKGFSRRTEDPDTGEVAGGRRRKGLFTFSDFHEIRCNVFSYYAVLTIVRLLRIDIVKGRLYLRA